MQWYIPFTILPGIALIILSTSNIMLTLNSEITDLKKDKEVSDSIIEAKLLQLKRLSWSIVLQYIGLFFFLLSGVIAALNTNNESLSEGILITGVILFGISIVLLIVYAINAVKIRQEHLH